MSSLKISQFISLFLLLALLTFAPLTFAHSQTRVIEITEEGFIPNEVTIDTNSTIFFLNKDKKSHWPASNPHPTHDLYPEFDPQRAINPGESWAFKPQKIGEWRYHDHLNPHFGGTVKVIAEVGSVENVKGSRLEWVQNLKKSWANLFSKIQNLFGAKYNLDSAQFIKSSATEQIAQLKKYANSEGAEKAWQFIKNTYKNQSGASGNIHDLAHLAGGLLFEKMDFQGLGNCSADFAFGCYHGFLDKAFAKNLDHLQDAYSACSKLGPDESGPVASCIHGIGHGVASFHNTADLKLSLADCRKLTSGREFCFDGVFMEFVRSAPDSFYKKEDPLYPCNELEQKFGPVYSFSCGRNAPVLFTGRFKMSLDQVIGICAGAESTKFKQACFDSVGFTLAATNNADQIITSCQSLEEEFMVRCIKSAAGELIFQEMPGWQEKSPEICNSLPGDYLAECLKYIDQIKKQYGR